MGLQFDTNTFISIVYSNQLYTFDCQFLVVAMNEDKLKHDKVKFKVDNSFGNFHV